MRGKFTIQSYSSGGAANIQVFRVKGEKCIQSLDHNTAVAVQVILRGAGKYFVNYRTHNFKANDVLVSRPCENHRIMLDEGSYLDKICLFFPSRIVGEYLPLSLYRCLPPVVHLSKKEAVGAQQTALAILGDLKAKPPYWYKKVVSDIWSLIILLYGFGQRREEDVDIHPALKEALDYIEKNFRSEINIRALSRKLDFSVGHLTHLFLIETKMGIRHYIIHRRVAEAKLLLHSRHHEVRSISREVGYTDYRLFLHQFTLFTGMTPEEYRTVLFPNESEAMTPQRAGRKPI